MPAPKGNGNAAKHGKSLITRALPYLINRVKDAATPEADLSPVERTLRQWREQAIRDQGGLDQWPVTKLEVLDTALGSLVILRSLDHYLFKLAAPASPDPKTPR